MHFTLQLCKGWFQNCRFFAFLVTVIWTNEIRCCERNIHTRPTSNNSISPCECHMNCRTHLQFATKPKTTVYEAAQPSQLCQNIAMPTHILPYGILEKCCCGWVYAIAYILLSLMYSCHWSWDGKPKEVHWILAQGYDDGGKKGQWRGQQWGSTVTEQDGVVAEEFRAKPCRLWVEIQLIHTAHIYCTICMPCHIHVHHT